MAVLTGSQVIAAIAPSYAVVLAARLLCALAHGVFWSVIAQVAASMVAPERAGRATAAAFAGNSLALVAGVPLISITGTLLGWRLDQASAAGGNRRIDRAGLGVALGSQPTREAIARRAADTRAAAAPVDSHRIGAGMQALLAQPPGEL